MLCLLKNNFILTSPALLVDGDEDDGVGDDDYDQGDEIHGDDSEHGVRRLPLGRRERVERDALGVPLEVRVRLDVKYVCLVEDYNRVKGKIGRAFKDVS